MRPLNFYLIHADEIMSDYSLNHHRHALEDYKRGGRQDIFDNPNIFTENSCSIDKEKKNFSLFNRVDIIDNNTIIVIGLYLELLEFWGEGNKLIQIIDDISSKYPNNFVVGYWNHDHDFSRYNGSVINHKNLIILNHGYTSSKTDNDILLPFWNISENLYNEPKTQFCSFIGTPNNGLRSQLVSEINKFKNNDIIHGQVRGDEYLKSLNRTLFSLCPLGGHGGGGFSYRVFESIRANSIPVIIVDSLVYPMTDIVNWDDISIRIKQSEINNMSEIYNKLRSIDYNQKLSNLSNNKDKFTLLGVQEYVYTKILKKIENG